MSEARRDRDCERAAKRIERLLEPARFGCAVIEAGARSSQPTVRKITPRAA